MRAAGDVFEQRACAELERAGLKLLARNYNTRFGELDLVMLDRDTVVFVEVRHRRNASHGDAAASITAGKQAKLIKAAALWRTTHAQWAQFNCRFDVVTYDGHPDHARMEWLRSAFEA
ncbi:MAG: YraN family protein [Pseudomonadota bacterium]|jgi:putative endonuclease|nr:YraN family protein [Xanthomonadaceae bacterium]MDE2249399.1 YraN family protein [Xanthomonadaceae bacterium]MDE3209375.1 YraN family protein [Pseudomonadota bacterium]